MAFKGTYGREFVPGIYERRVCHDVLDEAREVELYHTKRPGKPGFFVSDASKRGRRYYRSDTPDAPPKPSVFHDYLRVLRDYLRKG